MIEVKNLTKVYGKKQSAFNALKDVSFKINDGDSVAIIGKSGSGKSTLMHVMSGLDRPSDGSVTINGKNLHAMKAKAMDAFRAREMSFIFQAFFVEANQRAVDNVSLPLEIAKVSRRRRRELSLQALEAVELSDKSTAKARNLSGGQKQRLAIARAIVNKPKLIFADEPTGNLDSVTGDKIIELLFDLNKKLGATLVIVTHDHELAARCKTQVHLKDGQIDRITESSAARTKS
jgi:putative ABC transport system ATP-binding protein